MSYVVSPQAEERFRAEFDRIDVNHSGVIHIGEWTASGLGTTQQFETLAGDSGAIALSAFLRFKKKAMAEKVEVRAGQMTRTAEHSLFASPSAPQHSVPHRRAKPSPLWMRH